MRLWTEQAFHKALTEKIAGKRDVWEDVDCELRRRAERSLNAGPWSVTDAPGYAASGDKHDYYSEGPYWWPNPEDPEGPFIRRDGEFWPGRFVQHHNMLHQLCETVLLLTQAGYYLSEEKYLERAAYLLWVWFVDPETRMNPHLEYAQAVRGICIGRGIGIIDTLVLIKIVYAVGFLDRAGKYQELLSELRQWFTYYAHWLNTSQNGLEEKNYFNNHANWWNTQEAAYAVLIGDDVLLEECFERFRTKIIPEQLSEDGSFTDEINRTLSYHYCLFNLEACAVICELAHQQGVDLWHFETPDGKGMQRAIDFMFPYLQNPFLWKHTQIKCQLPLDQYALQLGALRLGREEYQQVNRELRKDAYLIRKGSTLGPLCLQPGF